MTLFESVLLLRLVRRHTLSPVHPVLPLTVFMPMTKARHQRRQRKVESLRRSLQVVLLRFLHRLLRHLRKALT